MIYTNSRSEQFLEVFRDGVDLYIRVDDIPGGFDGAGSLLSSLMAMQMHEMLDDLLTSRHDGGFSATSDPESFLDEFFLTGKEKYGSRLRFDYLQLERLSEDNPRTGSLAINFSKRWTKGRRETPAELSISIELDFPSVALYMPKAYPHAWLMDFYRDLEACDDSFEAMIVAHRYSESPGTFGWCVGLPKRDFDEVAMTSCGGSDFLQDAFKTEVLDFFLALKNSPPDQPLFSWGNSPNPVHVAVEIQEDSGKASYQWFKERMHLFSEFAAEISLQGDIGL